MKRGRVSEPGGSRRRNENRRRSGNRNRRQVQRQSLNRRQTTGVRRVQDRQSLRLPIEFGRREKLEKDKTTVTQATQYQPLGNLIKHPIKEWTEEVLRKGPARLAGDYHQLWNKTSDVYVDKNCTAFKKNRMKNRYRDVYCGDESRVRLKDGEGGDYIHASFVKIDKQRSVICTQGPLKDTVTDFWRMIWQEGTGVIVMLCQLNEKGQEKCSKYWNATENQSLSFGPFKITTKQVSYKRLEEGKKAACTCLEVEKGKETPRQILHVYYDSWPDQEIPNDSKSIPKLLQSLEDLKRKFEREKWEGPGPDGKRPNWPLVIHCSAGIGRTGTFAVLYMCKEIINHEKKIPDLAKAVEFVRQQRLHAVQTESQFLFIHCILLEMVTSHRNQLISPPQNYVSKVRKFINDSRKFR